MNAVAAIDIGNTRAKFGLISDPALGPVGEVTATVLEAQHSSRASLFLRDRRQ